MAANVLVVEDDEDNRYVLRKTLAYEGYAVETAPNGAAALLKLEGELPALVVMNLVMPVMDGFALAAEMARRGLRPQVPILVASGSASAVRRLGEIAPEGYLTKPWDIAVLLSEVERLAGRSVGLRLM
jgi:two-component system response regulator MprA